MKRRINKTAVSIVITYVILNCGLRMFLLSYANSYNKLNINQISPAHLTVEKNYSQLDILDKSFRISHMIDSDSRIITAVYLTVADEIRAAFLLSSKISEIV